MRRHISARPATTKYFSNLFVFKKKMEKEGLPRDDTPALGAGGLEFKSPRPDRNYRPHLLQVTNCVLHQELQCGNPAGRSAVVASSVIPKSSHHDEFAKIWGGRSATWKLLNGGTLSAHHLASMVKI